MKKLAMALCLVSTPALSCNLEDLAGSWNIFFDEYSCQLTVNNDGKIRKGQCLKMPSNSEASATRGAAKGRFKMLANCRVTGSFSTTDDIGDKIKVSISQSRLGSDHRYWQGISNLQSLGLIDGLSPVFGGEGASVADDAEYSVFSAVAF